MLSIGGEMPAFHHLGSESAAHNLMLSPTFFPTVGFSRATMGMPSTRSSHMTRALDQIRLNVGNPSRISGFFPIQTGELASSLMTLFESNLPS